MSNSKAAPRPLLVWSFAILMLALTGVFVALGIWQMQRLAEKETLIAAVAERTGLPPAPPPPTSEWADLDPAAIEFTPLALTGRFAADPPIRVFTSLAASTARGEFSGPGYWIVAPFVLDGGGTVFVNRGFVPQQQVDAAPPAPEGPQSLTGLARVPEEVNMFTPDANVADRIEWVRDPERLAALVDPALAPFAPFTLDQAAGPPGTLPQGGETVVEFPNNHLGYAITWFGFAAITPILLGFWIWRQRR
jgi:surfeit locus 1 family protein